MYCREKYRIAARGGDRISRDDAVRTLHNSTPQHQQLLTARGTIAAEGSLCTDQV